MRNKEKNSVRYKCFLGIFCLNFSNFVACDRIKDKNKQESACNWHYFILCLIVVLAYHASQIVSKFDWQSRIFLYFNWKWQKIPKFGQIWLNSPIFGKIRPFFSFPNLLDWCDHVLVGFPIPRDAVTNGNGDTTTVSRCTNFDTF